MNSHFIETPDGATLHVAAWGDNINLVPVICLAGLTRNHMDFAELAKTLNRPVYAFDYRGRGLSSHNATLADYTFQQEQADLRFAFHALNLRQAIFIGTSRGGLHSMMLTDMVVASVINDIGADIEIEGLLKIKASLSKRGDTPRDYNEAVVLLKSMLSDEFTSLSDEDWRLLAKGIWFDDGGLKLSYDPQLKGILDGITKDTPMVSTWHLFAALAEKPCFIIRGENSRLFSQDTYEKMVNYNEMTSGVVIKGQGHAPIMSGVVNDEIMRFIKTLS
jgi:pimeloyl-ACP methyl ester carboxylesterase